MVLLAGLTFLLGVLLPYKNQDMSIPRITPQSFPGMTFAPLICSLLTSLQPPLPCSPGNRDSCLARPTTCYKHVCQVQNFIPFLAIAWKMLGGKLISVVVLLA